MKHYKGAIIFLFLGLLSTTLRGQFSFGLRDSYYTQVQYTHKDKYSAAIEHSVYSEHFGFQRIRLLLEYRHNWEKLSTSIQPYVSSLWNRKYQDFGLYIKCGISILPKWNIDEVLNPHYDTGDQYSTCFSAGTTINLFQGISFLAHYNTIPEFRIPEKRVRIGFEFKNENLWVRPELSIPVIKDIKSFRTLVSMGYTIH